MKARALRPIAFVAALTFLVADAVYFFVVKFAGLVHSDAAVTVLMAFEAVKTKRIVPPTWYFANGDVWILGPQLYAMPLVASGVVGIEQLRATTIIGFAIQLAVLALAYRSLVGAWRPALAGAALTLTAWSPLHVLFVYVELAYGYSATTYVALFALVAAGAAAATEHQPHAMRVLAIGVGAYELVLALQNPMRGLVFGFFPVAVTLLWPFRGLSLRARAPMLLATAAGWVWARALYTAWLLPRVSLSIPSGHNDFVVKDLAGIEANLRMLEKGLFELSGAPDLRLAIVPTLVLTVAAVLRVVFEIFTGRDFTRLRFVCLAALAQLLAVLGPLVVGNLMVTPPSVRYLMPSLLGIFGLAALLVANDLRAKGVRFAFGLAMATTLPVSELASFVNLVAVHSYEYKSSGQWARRTGHGALADELVKRGLVHGFASYWNANLVSMMADGRTKSCSVFFAREPLPYRWNTDVACFDRASLPDRYYVVVRDDEKVAAHEMTTHWVEAPIERFVAGDEFEVFVFGTNARSTRWLDGPFPEGDRLRFPVRMPAVSVMFGRGDTVVEESDRLSLTGKPGVVLWGPGWTLPAGHYRVTWFGTGLGAEGTLKVEVSQLLGKTVFAEKTFAASAFADVRDGKLVAIDFTLAKPTRWMDLRVFTEGGTRLVLDRLELERVE